MSEPVVNAYITNLGKYNEGILVGEWLTLPTTAEQMQQTLKNIGIDGIRYEEYFITDYETSVSGLYNILPEYANLDELNYLASVLDELPEDDLEKLEAAVEYGDHTGSVKDIINLAQNLDCYDYYPDIHNEEDLGCYWIEESGCYEVPENWAAYIDYEKFGRDIAMGESSTFTKGGYIVNNGDSFQEYYDGEEIPDEYKVFAYPKREKTPQKKHDPEQKHKPQPSRDER